MKGFIARHAENEIFPIEEFIARVQAIQLKKEIIVLGDGSSQETL